MSVLHRVFAPLLVCGLCGRSWAQQSETLWLRGAVLHDGLGSPGLRGDVLIREGEILAVGAVEAPEGCASLDLQGLCLAPGFIDLHSHTDGTIAADPRSLAKIYQGVTTEILGENGSPVPRALKPSTRIRGDGPWEELEDFEAWKQRLEEHGLGVNLATFVGAGRLRELVLGMEETPAGVEALATMRALLVRELEAGALGLSSGLIYVPGRYASTEELIALASEAGKRGGLYLSHVRTEGGGVLDAIDEAARIGRESGCGVEILHLKVTGRSNHGRMEEIVARIEEHRASGLAIAANVYPYTATSTTATVILPGWAQEGGGSRLAQRLRDPEQRARIRSELVARDRGHGSFDAYLDTVMISRVAKRADREGLGRSVTAWANAVGVEPADFLLDLLERNGGRVGAVYLGRMFEGDLECALRAPWVSIGSDGSGFAPEGRFLEQHPHPRSYGAFVRFLARYVREREVMSWPEAIRRLTSQPAERLGIGRRGRLAPGWVADLVAFDPEAVEDRATFAEPHRLAGGVRHVWVAGEAVLRDGRPTGALPGRVLRREAKSKGK